jgi:hypothetical protein
MSRPWPSCSGPSVIGSVNDRRGGHVAGSSLLFVVGVEPPQATAGQAGRTNLTSGLGEHRHRACCGLVLPRPRNGTSHAWVEGCRAITPRPPPPP